MTIFAWIFIILCSIGLLASAFVIVFRLGEASGISKYDYDDYYDEEDERW
jgi:hypothetical protein